MKTNSKALKLIEMGLSANTVGKLTESQLDLLYNKFNLSEQATTGILNVPKGSPAEREAQQKKQAYVAYGSEMTENMGMDYASGYNPYEYGGNLPLNYNNPEDDANPDVGGLNDGIPTEGEIEEKKKEYNPWAICTSTLGKEFGTTERSDWSKSETNKYERCVKDVKKSIKEGKNPYHWLIEKEIVSLVERNLTPKMTKRDFIKTIFEAPTEAPTKPKTKPGVKPNTKPQRPPHPGKNPNPGENPAPKAQDLERAKEDVLNAIKSLLSNGKN
jgi:hypothetical protein